MENRILRKIICLIPILAFLSIQSVLTEELKEWGLPKLDVDIEQEICESYIEYLEKNENVVNVPIEDIIVLEYYGCYRGFEIVQMYGVDWEGTADEEYLGIAGYSFYFSSGSLPPYFLAYKDGEMLLVKDAYEQGFLSKEDIFALGVTRGDFVYPENCLQHTAKYVGARKSTLTEEGYTGDKICKYCYTFLEKGEIIPALVQNHFEDVKEKDYYFNAVVWAVNNKITYGYTDTIFGPNDKCTRAQIATLIWRTMGQEDPERYTSKFQDLDEDAYYYKAVLWASQNGIISGRNQNQFAPDDECTRAEIVTMLWRAKGKPAIYKTDMLEVFEDVSEDDYFYLAVYWARSFHVTLGVKYDMFAPDKAVTRGEMVTFLYRTFGNDALY